MIIHILADGTEENISGHHVDMSEIYRIKEEMNGTNERSNSPDQTK